MVSLLLSLVFILSCFMSISANASNSMSNFMKLNTYTEGQFSDISTYDWFAENVKTAYEFGIVNGNSETTFNPTGNITVAETITLASRIHNIYNGGTGQFEQGDPWYQPYVEYAISANIINDKEFENYTESTNRAIFAMIFSRALPSTEFPKINNITSIPDVPIDEWYAPFVYNLYNAGILTGSNEYGTFYPNNRIQRSEVAAIVTRMIDVAQRKIFELQIKTVAVDDPILLEGTGGDKQITLNWSFFGRNPKHGYEIYYTDTPGGTYELLATLTNRYAKSYTVSNLKDSTKYYFKIRAYLIEDNVKYFGTFEECSCTTDTHETFSLELPQLPMKYKDSWYDQEYELTTIDYQVKRGYYGNLYAIDLNLVFEKTKGSSAHGKFSLRLKEKNTGKVVAVSLNRLIDDVEVGEYATTWVFLDSDDLKEIPYIIEIY